MRLYLGGRLLQLRVVGHVGRDGEGLPARLDDVLRGAVQAGLPRAMSPTLAPRAPYSRAVARAMPALAPVMTTVWVMEVVSLLE